MITLRDRRVLVLGATGFIGRWVAREASRAGARVTLAARDTARASAVAAAYEITGTIAGVDVLDRGDVAALVRDVRPEITFNLIGYGVDRRETDTTLADAINVELVQHLLPLVAEVSARHDWPGLQFVHTGSALEYGMASGHLAEDTAVNPSTVYGRTKLAATQLVAGAAATGLRAVTARLFTVYGPGEHDGRLLPSVLAARSASAPIPMTNGLQQRDFTYVGDVVEGLLRAAVQPAAPWPTVNLATGRLHTVRQFVGDAERALGLTPGRFQFGALPTRAEEQTHDAVTVDRVRQWLGWVPDTPIAEGVAATAAFLAAHPGSAPS
ncbi:MAG: NAD-dependent epimerase/dehydratase family protein [Vicinamibacterales bacterium]